jgi:hypothetical protein
VACENNGPENIDQARGGIWLNPGRFFLKFHASKARPTHSQMKVVSGHIASVGLPKEATQVDPVSGMKWRSEFCFLGVWKERKKGPK